MQKRSSANLIPAPFDWIEIPGKNYSIAKYPTTNSQFALFIDGGGYKSQQWWSDVGWWHLKKRKWSEPRFWQNPKWNSKDQPVVGVSWYEAMAFCNWLSESSGENITLPTTDQWQYAAQGDDNRLYPWGNDWDCTRCNNSVAPCKSKLTTPVTQYEGKGDSFFCVVDMAGNCWEYCLEENHQIRDYYLDKEPSVPENHIWRFMGGGARYSYEVVFLCETIQSDPAHFRENTKGFRIVKLG